MFEGLVGNSLQIGARETTIMKETKFFFRQDRLQKEEIQKTLSPKGTGLDFSEKDIRVSTIKTELQVDNIHVLHDTLVNTPDNFVGGKIQHFYKNWSRITSDKWILNVICGYNIEFENTPIQNKEPKELVFNSDETNMVQREIDFFFAKRYHTLSDKC